MSEVSRIPVNGLWEQYGIGKTHFYELLSKLQIPTFKESNRSYLAYEDKELLDRYFSLDEPGRDDLVRERGVESGSVVPFADTANTSYNALTQTQWLQLFQLFADKTNERSRTYLECQLELEEYARAGYLLPTSEVRSLLGVKPHGEIFERGSFRFVRSGKIGAEAAWRVERVES